MTGVILLLLGIPSSTRTALTAGAALVHVLQSFLGHHSNSLPTVYLIANWAFVIIIVLLCA